MQEVNYQKSFLGESHLKCLLHCLQWCILYSGGKFFWKLAIFPSIAEFRFLQKEILIAANIAIIFRGNFINYQHNNFPGKALDYGRILALFLITSKNVKNSRPLVGCGGCTPTSDGHPPMSRETRAQRPTTELSLSDQLESSL